MTQAKLSIARAGSESRFVLNGDSLNKILQLAGTQIEILEYLQASLIEKAGKTPEFTGLMVEVAKLIKNAEYQLQEKEKLNPWSLVTASTLNDAPGLIGLLRAHLSKSEFDEFQDFLAESSVRHIEEQIQAGKIKEEDIVLDYAIGRSSQFMCAYSSGGYAFEGEEFDSMCKIFNRWLKENDMLTEDGVIYMRTGDKIRSENGKPVTADPEKIITMLSGNGFQKFLQEQNPKMRITIRQNDYDPPIPAGESVSQS